MSECSHKNWEIKRSTTFGMGTCKDCGEEIAIWILFNDLHERMEEIIKKSGG